MASSTSANAAGHGYVGDNLRFVPLGVDTEFFRPMGQTTNSIPVVSAGTSYRDWMSLDEALEGVGKAVVAASLPHAKMSNIRFYNPDFTGLRELYASARVFAMPLLATLRAAGLTALLSAMAMEKPVVATDSGGTREYVRDGVDGFLVPPGDVKGLASAIRNLLGDPEKAARMGQAARRKVSEGYSTRRLARDTAVLLRDVKRLSA